MADLRRELTQKAVEVGALLNLVQDDDERELLQEHYERVLNDELYAGSQNRAAATPLLASLATITPIGSRTNVVALDPHSRRIR